MPGENRYLAALERQQAQAAERTIVGETSPREGADLAGELQRKVGLDSRELVEAAGVYVRDEMGLAPQYAVGREVAVAFVSGAEAAAAALADIGPRDAARRELAWLMRQVEHWIEAKNFGVADFGPFTDEADEALFRAHQKAMERQAEAS